MTALGALSLVAAALFMTLEARGNWSFVLPFRATKLAGLVLVAVAVAVATVVFQTITRNRILTPGIMGFGALYVLIQTVLVFGLGSARVAGIDPRALFAAEVALMLVFAGLLFRALFGGSTRSLHLLLLVGIVCGTLFASIAGLLQRLIDPGEFLILQDRLFASFNGIDDTLLGTAAIVVAAVCAVLWRWLPVLDVLALGREHAIALGVAQDRMVALALGLVTILVAVSTALVGPIAFLGLLVANLAYMLLPTARHAVLLPGAALIAVICLVGGQTLLERVLSYDTVLAVVIEFAGGLVFLLLVIKGATR
ncbi:iron complex transport system permease protein [Loktanella fryxellensis]|uniref:Iron complex transport system permease protein n=1 Tax=Loktanella fryxellensis TaxID=245187 RepID=A0A1H8IPS7_9RHOB|nr:iron chelate uptake ABC transporter family permease subunit [Loktanella fryxellensis]SEN70372.1 iron complex transport system permease protein [Loktanella fryxellensis]